MGAIIGESSPCFNTGQDVRYTFSHVPALNCFPLKQYILKRSTGEERSKIPANGHTQGGGTTVKVKRSLIVLFAAVLMLALALPAFAAGAGEKKPGAKLKIAYIRPTNEPYYKYGFDGAKMMADAMGVELFGYISEMKPEKELNAVEDAITQKMDGIILVSISQTSIESSVNTAFKAKVPIMMLFGYSEALKDKMVGSVQADPKISGMTIGKWVADNISEGQVACIMGQPGRGDAEGYRDNFVSEVKKNSNLQYVGDLPGDWNRQKAFNAMQNLITSYPDLKACFVQNEDMALGAIQALKEAGKEDQVAIVSQNGAPYGLESIAGGGIKATVGWSPSQEAQLALRVLVEKIRDKKVQPKLTITPMTVITAANVSAATPWEPTADSTQATLKLDLSKIGHALSQ
jgi:ABC-type sugar transport system substrate-binding protein